MMALAVLVIIGFFALALSRPQTVPGRMQSLAEIWYGFVAGIVRDVNHDDGKPFVPLVFTIFSFIFVANMLGMFSFPGLHAFTVMSHIAVTGVMAIFVFFLVIAIGACLEIGAHLPDTGPIVAVMHPARRRGQRQRVQRVRQGGRGGGAAGGGRGVKERHRWLPGNPPALTARTRPGQAHGGGAGGAARLVSMQTLGR
jgi:hypothetical protein